MRMDGKFWKVRHGLLAVAALLAMATTGQASAILFDPDGAGANSGARSIGGFTLSSGNTLSVGSVPLGGVFPTTDLPLLFQATINGFTDPNGDAIVPPAGGLDSAYELTLVLRFNERITASSFDGSGNPVSARFTLSPNQVGSFIEIYYDTNINRSATAGTGFNDGRLIFQGTPSPTLDNNGGFTFQAIPYPAGTNTALDQNGTDQYPGVTTLLGTGSAKVGSLANLQDPSFFLTKVSQITINGNLNLPYSQTNPSALFDGLRNLTGLGTSGVAPTVPGVASVGANNGTSGPNFMFQTIANGSFETAVPEPGTIGTALLGVGSLVFGFVRSRRRTAKSAA